MKVYLASRFSTKEEMAEKAKELQTLGITVTSRWLREKLDSNADLTDCTDRSNRDHAKIDIEDINEANILVLFTVSPLEATKRGGRHWECGYAYALYKEIIICGPRKNVFHYLAGVKQFNTWKETKEYLNGRK